MDSQGIPKLTDFGLSRLVICSQPFFQRSNDSKDGGTINWMAYELLEIFTESHLSSDISTTDAAVQSNKESDVWSLGMVIYVSLPASVYIYPF